VSSRSEIIFPKVKLKRDSSVMHSPNTLPGGAGNEKTLAEPILDSSTMLTPFQRFFSLKIIEGRYL
jgi:hypothetical protein